MLVRPSAAADRRTITMSRSTTEIPSGPRRSRASRRGVTRSVLATLMFCSAALAFGTRSPLAVAAPSPAQVRRRRSGRCRAPSPMPASRRSRPTAGGSCSPALAGDRRSVFRTDRQTNETIELSPVPDGVRAGDTIHPRLSADGCVIAAITEIPFDLFRDDDQDDRWDVYRLVVPECGGQPNAWELVSARELHRHRAATTCSPIRAPALTGVGRRDRLRPPGPRRTRRAWPRSASSTSPCRSPRPAACSRWPGMPAEAPGGAFLYRGARDPVISQNGRHLAFVSDTTASEALPGLGHRSGGRRAARPRRSSCGTGRRQDQRRAVRLISGHDGVAVRGRRSRARHVRGRPRDRVHVARPHVAARQPHALHPRLPVPGVPIRSRHRRQRDLRRAGPAPAAGAGLGDRRRRRRTLGLPEAGDAPSWAPAVNADGSQIAFVTDATNLLPSRRAGGGGEHDGDLLVAEFVLGSIRRVLDGADTTGVPGAHGNPALSKTGQVIAFDTMAAAAIPGTDVHRRSTRGRAVVTVEADAAAVAGGARLRHGAARVREHRALRQGAQRRAGRRSSRRWSNRRRRNFKITGGTCLRGIIVAAGA